MIFKDVREKLILTERPMFSSCIWNPNLTSVARCGDGRLMCMTPRRKPLTKENPNIINSWRKTHPHSMKSFPFQKLSPSLCCIEWLDRKANMSNLRIIGSRSYSFHWTEQYLNKKKINNLPMVMILEHGDGGMCYVALFRRQVCVHVGVKHSAKFFYDDSTVSDLNSVHFNERQLAFSWTESHLVVHILQASVLTKQK